MTTCVWKFPIPTHTNRFTIEMPKDAVILSVQLAPGAGYRTSDPMLWVLVNTNAPRVKRVFRLFFTGEEIDEDDLPYLRFGATFRCERLVYHLFDVVDPRKS